MSYLLSNTACLHDVEVTDIYYRREASSIFPCRNMVSMERSISGSLKSTVYIYWPIIIAKMNSVPSIFNSVC